MDKGITDCDNCQNPENQIVTNTDCEVCHNQDQHMEGTIRLKNNDTGAAIVYNPDDLSSLEPFCLSCHDSDCANGNMSPFASTFNLGEPPYSGSNKIADNWAKTYGHATNGLTCMGTGEPGTGCHGNNGSINAHGSDNEALAAKEYNYSAGEGVSYNESMYALCFECHANYPGITKEDTLGVVENGIFDNYNGWFNNCGDNSCHGNVGPSAPPPYYNNGITTRFADHNVVGDPEGFNDPLPVNSGPVGLENYGITSNNNLHWLHLGMYNSGFRGVDPNNDLSDPVSLVICSNCHSVHGSDTEYGVVHDEIGYDHDDDGTNFWGMMKGEAYGTPDVLQGYPTYCSMSCHETTGQTRAWFDPIIE